MSLVFQAIGTDIHFYAMSLQHQSIYVFMDIASLKIPTQRADIRNLLLELDTISQLAHLHKTLFISTNNTIPHSPTLSYELFDDLNEKAKGKKRDLSQVDN
jgi:hypothetical protein